MAGAAVVAMKSVAMGRHTVYPVLHQSLLLVQICAHPTGHWIRTMVVGAIHQECTLTWPCLRGCRSLDTKVESYRLCTAGNYNYFFVIDRVQAF